jgi:hypothetical protein
MCKNMWFYYMDFCVPFPYPEYVELDIKKDAKSWHLSSQHLSRERALIIYTSERLDQNKWMYEVKLQTSHSSLALFKA